MKMNNNAVVSMGIIAMLVIIALIGGGAYIAHDQGYIPIDALLDTKEPVGDSSVIESTCDCECNDWLTVAKHYFSLDDTKYKMWTVNAVTPASSIIDDYLGRIKAEGYILYKPASSGITANPGVVDIDGYSTSYAIYFKGITFITILTTHIQSGNTADTGEICVIYATGNLMVLKDYIGSELSA